MFKVMLAGIGDRNAKTIRTQHHSNNTVLLVLSEPDS